jgi:hypothetical protein
MAPKRTNPRPETKTTCAHSSDLSFGPADTPASTSYEKNGRTASRAILING